MSRIKLLPPHEAQKIAAGEVVERPANVVKELIENSLDAGATHITLYLEAGGKKLIRIIDNGHGMNTEDAVMCIVAHATSKITSVDELDSLTTFGFRGEALSSIAAVSRMKIITRARTDQEGFQLYINASIVEKNSPAAANIGTDITIEDLFFNVPARKKFLKTDKTEWNAIHQLVLAYALDYPEYQFTIYHNQSLILSCTSCTTLEQRAQQLFNHTITERLIPLHGEEKAATANIEGIISDHQYGRYDRSHLYLFVNRRWVKNYKLASALIKGYQGILQQGQYPCAILSITVPPHTIDINIHPRKEEVQFLHPRIIENCIQELVKRTLNDRMGQQLHSPKTSHVAYQSLSAPSFFENRNHQTINEERFTAPLPPIKPFSSSPHISVPNNSPSSYKLPEEKINPAPDYPTTFFEERQENTVEQESFKIIGQLLQTYILIETAQGLMLIDQHAAHERILYEHIGTHLQKKEIIRLLFPEAVRLSPADYAVVVENTMLLQEQGIEIEPWSDNQILITAAPIYVKPQALKDIIAALVGALHEEYATHLSSVAHTKIQHALQAMIACKAAIKAHDILQQHEMLDLVKKLFNTQNKLSCPHGRPTSWLVTQSDIERKFKRIL